MAAKEGIIGEITPLFHFLTRFYRIKITVGGVTVGRIMVDKASWESILKENKVAALKRQKEQQLDTLETQKTQLTANLADPNAQKQIREVERNISKIKDELKDFEINALVGKKFKLSIY